MKVRDQGRVVSKAVVLAVGVRATGEREVLGLDVGPSEDGAFWTQFLRGLVARVLAGVQLVISDAHEGLKAAVAAVLQGAAWQRCRGHFIREALALVPKMAAPMVAATIRTVFVQPDAPSAWEQWRRVVDGFRSRFPRLAALMGGTCHGVDESGYYPNHDGVNRGFCTGGHGSVTTSFFVHLKDGSFTVAAGDPVTQRQQVATIDNTGNSTGTHLHLARPSGASPSVWSTGKSIARQPASPPALVSGELASATPARAYSHPNGSWRRTSSQMCQRSRSCSSSCRSASPSPRAGASSPSPAPNGSGLPSRRSRMNATTAS